MKPKLATFTPGDKVRLTGDHLRNCGMIASNESLSRWLIVACDCDLCKRDHVAVNERLSREWLLPDEPDHWVHIHKGALEKCR